MAARRGPAIGLVGPGRRRNGLGPFLAAHVEAAGGRVVAVAGRDAARTGAAAAELAARLGHPIRSHVSVAALIDEEDLDGLVVASPIAAHLEALELAAAAAVPTLCEKPLVAPEQSASVEPLLARFAAGDVLLMEHCQLPCVLPALRELHPGVDPSCAAEVEVGISPSVRGRSMLLECLSHLLSIVQELAPVDRGTRLARVAFSTTAPEADALTAELELEGPFPRLRARLVMRVCPEQPRPAWVAVDGARMDRRIDMEHYAISFVAGGREVAVEDPSAVLVGRFVQRLRGVDPSVVASERERVRERARLFAAVLAAWDRAESPSG